MRRLVLLMEPSHCLLSAGAIVTMTNLHTWARIIPDTDYRWVIHKEGMKKPRQSKHVCSKGCEDFEISWFSASNELILKVFNTQRGRKAGRHVYANMTSQIIPFERRRQRLPCGCWCQDPMTSQPTKPHRQPFSRHQTRHTGWSSHRPPRCEGCGWCPGDWDLQ